MNIISLFPELPWKSVGVLEETRVDLWMNGIPALEYIEAHASFNFQSDGDMHSCWQGRKGEHNRKDIQSISLYDGERVKSILDPDSELLKIPQNRWV